MPVNHGRLHVVTGAFGYTGRWIARELLDRGHRVRTLTGHPDRADPLADRVPARPFRFDAPARMAEAMEGAAVLHNTYWIRFEHGDRTFRRAVRHSRALFEAARRAGVGRVVHVGITNPDPDSPYPYFRGKARVEEALSETGLPHTVLRPALFFGGAGVLVNNVAWLVRRFPVFPVPGGGRQPMRPIHVGDLAERAADEAERADGRRVVDAVGPERLTLRGLVREAADALGTRTRPVDAPRWLVRLSAWLVGRLVDDVVLTRDEIGGLADGLLDSEAPAAGDTRLSAWLRENADRVGREWASELDRHYR